MDFFEWVHYEWWHIWLGTMMSLSWTGGQNNLCTIGILQRCIVGFNRTTVADLSTYVCMAGSFQLWRKQWQYMYMVASGTRHVSGSCQWICFLQQVNLFLEATMNLLFRLSVQKGVWNYMDSMVCTDTLMTLVILFSWFLVWWYLRMTLLWCIPMSSWWHSLWFAVFWSGNIYNRTDFWPQRCFVNFEDFMMTLLDSLWDCWI